MYRHYKGNLYVLVCEGRHSETHEELVVYRDARNPRKVWVRPKGMFFDSIHLDGEDIPRFQRVADYGRDTSQQLDLFLHHRDTVASRI
jgi:hypothetical protein